MYYIYRNVFQPEGSSVLMNTCIHSWNELSSQNKAGGKSNQSQSDKSRIIMDKKRIFFFFPLRNVLTVMFVKNHFDVLSLMGPMHVYILDMNQFYSWICADWNESLCGRRKLQL